MEQEASVNNGGFLINVKGENVFIAINKEIAYALGYDLIGIAPAGRAPHAEAYRRWLAQGHAAEMAWLGREPDRREDPRLVLPGARSVVVVGLSYFVLDPATELWRDPSRGRIARYAWGLDYHEVMLPRLRELGDLWSERPVELSTGGLMWIPARCWNVISRPRRE
jgi:epoxyqueuosine reductase